MTLGWYSLLFSKQVPIVLSPFTSHLRWINPFLAFSLPVSAIFPLLLPVLPSSSSPPSGSGESVNASAGESFLWLSQVWRSEAGEWNWTLPFPSSPVFKHKSSETWQVTESALEIQSRLCQLCPNQTSLPYNMEAPDEHLGHISTLQGHDDLYSSLPQSCPEGVFWGSDLVDWLTEQGLCARWTKAKHYAVCFQREGEWWTTWPASRASGTSPL